jgi:hypothetical protein
MGYLKRYLNFLKSNLVFVAITVVIVMMFFGATLLPKILGLKAKIPGLKPAAAPVLPPTA